MKELTIRNELTAFINDYNEAELALFLVLCRQIQHNELDDVDGKDFFQIKYSDLYFGKNYSAKELEDLIKNFYQKSIKTTLVDDLVSSKGVHLGKKGDTITNTPFYSILPNKENRVFNCFVNPFLISFIKEIIGNFTILDIEKVFKINGKYARKLYLLIVRYKNKSDNYRIVNPEEIIEINFLKDVLGYDKNKENKEFLRLLKKIVKDIKTYISGLDYSTIRTGRKISHVKFSWDLENRVKNINKTSKEKENTINENGVEQKIKNKRIKNTLEFLEQERAKKNDIETSNDEDEKLYSTFERMSNTIKIEIEQKAISYYRTEIGTDNLNASQIKTFELSKKAIILKIMKGEI